MTSFDQHVALTVEKLPDDWSAKQVSNCFVVSHAEPKYSREVVEKVESLMGWLDETFPYIGPDEYVRPPIIRICEGEDEERAFRRGSGSNKFSESIELVTRHANRDSHWEDEGINRWVMWHWFRERDAELFFALPYWLSSGLSRYIERAEIKSRKLTFKQDDWDKKWVRQHLRAGSVLEPNKVMQVWWGISNSTSSRDTGALIHALMSPKVQRHERFKSILPDYIKNVRAYLDELEAKKPKEIEDAETKPKKALTEEEETAKKALERSLRRSAARELASTVFERTFGDWSKSDWDKLANLYFGSIK